MKRISEKIFGFPIKFDWTFFWMFVVYIFVYKDDYDKMNYNIALLAAIYFCVLLHEFGHVYAAKWLGYPCEQIKMYMIGGVATITGDWDKKPKHELLIVLAGPMVNVIIAITIASGYVFDIPMLEKIVLAKEDTWIKFLPDLAFANLVLVVFNILPIFPLDGGRIFRAILSMITKNHKKATLFINYTALVLSILLGAFMAYAHQYITVLISLLIFVSNLFEILTARRKDKEEKLKEERRIERIKNLPKEVTVLFRKEDMRFFGTYKGAFQSHEEIPNDQDPVFELDVFGRSFRRPNGFDSNRMTHPEIVDFFTSLGYSEIESNRKDNYIISYVFAKA